MAIQRLNIKVFVTTQPSSIPGRPAVYKEGEFIAGVVWMTNLGDQPVCVCSSSSLYQDRPQLFKDGHEVPYIEGRNEWLGKYWNSEEPCHEVLRIPDFFKLEPHVRTRVGWFVISEAKQKTGNIKWYDTLGVGHYRLSLTRKFQCCAGPEARSDSFDFEIIENDFIYSESVNRMSRLTADVRKAFDLAWSALRDDPDIPEKELTAYSVELIEKEGDSSYFFYFHSRRRAKFFAERDLANFTGAVKSGVLTGRDSGYWVRKSDYTIPMRVK